MSPDVYFSACKKNPIYLNATDEYLATSLKLEKKISFAWPLLYRLTIKFGDIWFYKLKMSFTSDLLANRYSVDSENTTVNQINKNSYSQAYPDTL